MSYPIKGWKKLRRTYRFGVPTFYSKFHLGVDYIVPIGTKLKAWDKISVKPVYGKDGGNQAHVKYDGKLFRFLHLKELPRAGEYKKDKTFALTGNTGKSTAPHLHLDLSKNGKLELSNLKNFIDPDKYFKDWNEQQDKKENKKDKKKDTTPKQDEVVKVPVTVVSETSPEPQKGTQETPKQESDTYVSKQEETTLERIINWLYSALIK